MENSKITKKQQGQETKQICQANKEKYEGILQKKELYFTLPISTYYQVPKDRKLDLLPTKRNYYFQRFDRFSCHGQSCQCSFLPLCDSRCFLCFFQGKKSECVCLTIYLFHCLPIFAIISGNRVLHSLYPTFQRQQKFTLNDHLCFFPPLSGQK